MKNINQLKKEIEKRNKLHRKEAERLNIEPLSDGGWEDTIELEAELKILKQVCEEIKKRYDKVVNEFNKIPEKDTSKEAIKKKFSFSGAYIILEELLKKFQGEEK